MSSGAGSAITDVVAKLREYELQLVDALERVRKALAVLEDDDSPAPQPKPPTMSPVGNAAAAEVEAGQARKTLTGLTVAQAALIVMEGSTGPMHVKDITTKLQALGYRADQRRTDFQQTVLGTLSRRAREQGDFTALGRGYFELRPQTNINGNGHPPMAV